MTHEDPNYPDTIGANHFIINTNFSEVLITVGHTRCVIRPDLSSAVGIEWLQSVSVSPAAAKQLLKSLSASVERYEREWGAIAEIMPLRPDGAAN